MTIPPLKKKVLHIEDEKNIQVLVKGILEPEGYQVFGAIDAVQGLMMVRQVNPDLIILDLKIPAGGGMTVYQRLRLLTSTLHIPVLVFSGNSIEEIKGKMASDSYSLILRETLVAEELLAAVKSLARA